MSKQKAKNKPVNIELTCDSCLMKKYVYIKCKDVKGFPKKCPHMQINTDLEKIKDDMTVALFKIAEYEEKQD